MLAISPFRQPTIKCKDALIFQGNHCKYLHAPKIRSTKSMEETTIKCLCTDWKVRKKLICSGTHIESNLYNR